jgi:hypothetical protein
VAQLKRTPAFGHAEPQLTNAEIKKVEESLPPAPDTSSWMKIKDGKKRLEAEKESRAADAAYRQKRQEAFDLAKAAKAKLESDPKLLAMKAKISWYVALISLPETDSTAQDRETNIGYAKASARQLIATFPTADAVQWANSVIGYFKSTATSDAVEQQAVAPWSAAAGIKVGDPGAKTTGQITIVIGDTLLTTRVNSDTIFQAGKSKFKTSRNFVGVTSKDSVVDPSVHRLISKRDDGNFAFDIDVEALDAGENPSVRRNTDFPLTSITPELIGNIVSARAAQDFSSGRNGKK